MGSLGGTSCHIGFVRIFNAVELLSLLSPIILFFYYISVFVEHYTIQIFVSIRYLSFTSRNVHKVIVALGFSCLLFLCLILKQEDYYALNSGANQRKEGTQL